jgi:hypothetical protein
MAANQSRGWRYPLNSEGPQPHAVTGRGQAGTARLHRGVRPGRPCSRLPGRRAGPREEAKHGPFQGVESAAEQAMCVATESTIPMRVYGTVWLAKKMPTDPRNHAEVELGLMERHAAV